MTYDRLTETIDRTRSRLRQLGIGPSDRVAMVLPNGPEMAAAFLGVASAATAAPLNPAYRAPEFDFYLADLGAKALITTADADSPDVAVAASRGIPTIELTFDVDDVAGAFDLTCSNTGPAAEDAPSRSDDVALVLHTSGTTSRPKIVPLTQANLCASAEHIRHTLELSAADRCLNVMPLFHIHGLIAAVLASLSGGASVACTPGFVATEFFGWIDAFEPSWYTAVPTMHQAILARAEANRPVIERHRLRFIRSSSSSLPPVVAEGLERVFGVPVIEAYGMTEAAHQMCCSPLPPRARKFGSVGPAAGPDVEIMDEQGGLLNSGQIGEVVIRGANVTSGYENNPEANDQAFVDGWFRTGDQGYFDTDGYLHLTGRLKELIIRGGENIAPREVDEALLAHPAIMQAVGFGMPDRRLGEEVAAAVVLEDGQHADEQELRRFAAERLTDHKVPRRILIVDQIPKGPTGKLQRIGLAAKLGLADVAAGVGPAAYIEPRNEHEAMVAGAWRQVLGVERVGAKDDFFALGGDSVLAAQVIVRIAEQAGVELPMLVFFEAPIVEDMAGKLAEALAATGGVTNAPIDEQKMSQMLERLEQMSEEDARRLLDEG
jgi:acyl-CoA synthetase (AMP-forming)/AMP-acid ligase II